MFKKVLCFVTGVLFVLTLAGCGSLLDRSLIFATHTTIGVEVSASPVETGNPIVLIIGYKRSEGVINPVYDKDGIYTCCDPTSLAPIPKYRPEAYSVIAKIHGEVGAKAAAAESTMSVAQWFSTGAAAKIMAGQPGITAAVSGNSKIAEAEAKAREEIRISNTDEMKALRERYGELTKSGAKFVKPVSYKGSTISSPEAYADALAASLQPGSTADGIMNRGPLKDAQFIIAELKKHKQQ